MAAELTDIKGIGPAKADTLAENGYESVEDLANADPDKLTEVDGFSGDRGLEFIVAAENLLTESDDEPDGESGDEFDLTPAEVGDEVETKDDSEATESDVSDSDEEEDPDDSDDEESAESESEDDEENPVYSVELSFDSQREYDTFHAALMRYHENIYTGNQPASDVMHSCLESLYANESSVTLELDEYGLNTLHTAVKQTRTQYQGDNLISHMEALQAVEGRIDEIRRDKLF